MARIISPIQEERIFKEMTTGLTIQRLIGLKTILTHNSDRLLDVTI